MLNFQQDVTVGIGGPLIIAFEIRPDLSDLVVQLEYRGPGDDWEVVGQVSGYTGRVRIEHERLGVDRLQFRLHPIRREEAALSGWITVDRSQVLQPVTLITPHPHAHVARYRKQEGIIQWERTENFIVDAVTISIKPEGAAFWTFDTTVYGDANQCSWPSSFVYAGNAVLKLQALGYEDTTAVVIPLVVEDEPALWIEKPVGGDILYHHKMSDVALCWRPSGSVNFAAVEVEMARGDDPWQQIGVYDQSEREIPFSSLLSKAGKYRLRLRRVGGAGWVESGTFFYAHFQVALAGNAHVAKRGAPWTLDHDIVLSGTSSIDGEKVTHFMSSDGGKHWDSIDIVTDIITAAAGNKNMIRIEKEYEGFVLCDTTATFSITENLTEFFPPLEAGSQFHYRYTRGGRQMGAPTTTFDDTLEIQILSVSSEASRFVYQARSRFIGSVDSSWSAMTVYEENSGLHEVTGLLATGGRIFRYLDADVDTISYDRYINQYPYSNYPRSWSGMILERGIGLKRSWRGSASSPMQSEGSGWTFIRRW
ncbi:hypothetical protein KQI65_13895 [bacterium]|nr:hypothetical protein [bacterium]